MTSWPNAADFLGKYLDCLLSKVTDTYFLRDVLWADRLVVSGRVVSRHVVSMTFDLLDTWTFGHLIFGTNELLDMWSCRLLPF